MDNNTLEHLTKLVKECEPELFTIEQHFLGPNDVTGVIVGFHKKGKFTITYEEYSKSRMSLFDFCRFKIASLKEDYLSGKSFS